ncbi:MAG: hypothetical protein RMJ96_05460 [Candidatus Bipolaricaulota bacterium]|nr:hypothetical protein [Candidatus Bipolaricaulota bacterium]
MNPKQREVFAEKSIDLGHVTFGALVVGQFLTERPFSWVLFVLGVVVLAASYAVSYLLLKGGE